MGKSKERRCTWRLVIIREYVDGSGAEEIWHTECGVGIGIEDDKDVVAPYEFALYGFYSPDFTYCPYCGSPIELVEMEDGGEERATV